MTAGLRHAARPEGEPPSVRVSVAPAAHSRHAALARVAAGSRSHEAYGGSTAVAGFAAGTPFGDDRNLTARCLHRRSAKNGIGTFAVLD